MTLATIYLCLGPVPVVTVKSLKYACQNSSLEFYAKSLGRKLWLIQGLRHIDLFFYEMQEMNFTSEQFKENSDNSYPHNKFTGTVSLDVTAFNKGTRHVNGEPLDF